MEDVWNQINQIPLNHHHHLAAAAPSPAITPFHRMFFQDFLPPLSGNNIKDPGPPAKYGSSVPADEISVPAPVTVLSLSPCPDFEYPESSNDLVKQNPQVCSKKPSYFSHDYDVMPAHSSADFSPFSKKRESGQNGGDLCDRRHKRMMKNRESAARSRSRRQAYTNELELEIAKLAEENALLKKQHEKLLMTVASSDETLKQHHQQDQVPNKHRLQRTSTWPF